MIFKYHSHSFLKAAYLAVVLAAGVGRLAAQTETDFINSVNSSLTSLTATLGNPTHPIVFSGNLVYANGAVIANVPEPVLMAYIDGLKATGVQRVDVNPGYTSISDPNVAVIYDKVVKHIRELGLQLSINPEVSRDELGKGKTFQDYLNTALQTFPQMAARYHPDNFVIVHEPTTMDARMGGVQTTVQEWDAFIRAVAPLVKQAAPHTRLGAGGFQNGALPTLSKQENLYFQDFVTISDLDFMTMDIYNDDTFTSVPSSCSGCSSYSDWIKLAKSNGKAALIEETWVPAYLPNPLPASALSGAGFLTKSLDDLAIVGAASSDFASLDVAWLQAIAKFASANEMEAMTAFTTEAFFVYGGPGNGQGKISDPTYGTATKQTLQQSQSQLTSAGQGYLADSQQWGVKVATSISSASYATLPSIFNKNCGSAGTPCNADTTVAPDTLVSAFGADLATTTILDGTFPASLGGTKVTLVDSSNTSYALPLYFVSQGQVNYYVSSAVQPGPATITVTSGDGNQTTGVILISPVTPGLYTANANGQGAASAIAICAGTCTGWPNRLSNGQFYQNTFTCSSSGCVPEPIKVASGDTVVVEFFGTGLRHLSSLSAIGASFSNGQGVNMQNVAVQYAGSQNGYKGLDQVNVQIPQSLAGSGELNVALTVQDVVNNVSATSNTVTINIQ